MKVGEIVCKRADKKTSANWRIGLNTEHANYTALTKPFTNILGWQQSVKGVSLVLYKLIIKVGAISNVELEHRFRN